jgi:hypothetical protein
MVTCLGIGLTLPVNLAKDPSVVLIWMVSMLVGSGFGMLGRTFSTYEVLIEGDHIQFGYLDWKVSMPIADIRAHAKEDITWMTYRGLGWRVGLDGTIAYVCRKGPAVILETPIHTYSLSCYEPDQVRTLLDTLAAEHEDTPAQPT